MLQPADTTIAVLDADATRATTEQPAEGIERVMLADDKLPVVLAVVLVIWAGILLLLIRTDRRLARLERDLDATR
ncbi:CcmD family protein [Rubrivirga sp.]|uniref:CcmD family protein n=1 Tax=Rubrivirga sp. TaxID=1885344 RepID=UPI003C7951E9